MYLHLMRLFRENFYEYDPQRIHPIYPHAAIKIYDTQLGARPEPTSTYPQTAAFSPSTERIIKHPTLVYIPFGTPFDDSV